MFTDEIAEQSDALRALVQFYRSEAGAELLERCATLPGADEAVTFTGMGSSLYSSYAVLPALWAGQRWAASFEAGEILHYGLPGWRPHGPLVAVSQSGESAETLALARRLVGVAPLIAVTNEPDSGLAQIAQVTLPMHAGIESAISTKTYTNTLGVLHLLTASLLGNDLSGIFTALESSAAAMDTALSPDLESAIADAAALIDEISSVHFIGRGPSLSATYVGALTIGEGARVTAVGLPAASFRHGPMELAGDGHAAILFMPDGPTRPLMEKLRNDLERVHTRTVTISHQKSEALPEGALEIGTESGVNEEAFFPFPAAIIVERILAEVAKRRHITPGDFRYGGKVTAEE